MNRRPDQNHPIWGVRPQVPDDPIGRRTSRYRGGPASERTEQMRGAGRVVFAAILLIMVGVLNIFYGIGALDDANYFAGDTRYVLDNLNTLGWVLIILGVVQLTGGISLMGGRGYGRMLGIIAGSVGAVGALLSIGGSNPWWSLCVFALCVYIVHGIVVFGEDEARAGIS
jgi:hypothetical protein